MRFNFLNGEGKFVVLLVGIVYLVFCIKFHRWPQEFRGGDAWGYYSHLPATFIYHDVGDYTKTIEATRRVWPGENLSTLPTPIGRQCNKYPLGVAVLLAPFFLLAHWYCLMSGAFPADGFGPPYAIAACAGVFFYVLTALLLLYAVLKKFFSVGTAAMTILAIALATNLFYFTSYNNLLSHAFLFSLYAFLLFSILRFEEKPGYWRAGMLGLATGLIMLSRLHEGIVLLVPLLWGVWNMATLKNRFVFLRQNIRFVLCAVAVAALCLLPQAIYYKYVSGAWLYYAYTGESFNFSHPRILDGLFHFSNGWLVYTPIMIFSLIGLFRLKKFVPALLLPLLAFLALHVFISYSWWCWNYINGFGSRPMVETYPLLALPLAAYFTWGKKFAWKRILDIALIAGFAYLNVVQTWQIHSGILWTESANKAYYLAVFGKLHPGIDAVITYDSKEKQPSRPLTLVKALGADMLEDSTDVNSTPALQHSGKRCIEAGKTEFAATLVSEPVADIQPGDWVKTSVWGFVKGNEIIYNQSDLAQLIVEIFNPDGARIKYRQIKISSKIGNPDNSIWNTGSGEMWGEAAFYVKIPRSVKPGAHIKTYVWNPARQKIYIDDISLNLYRKK